MDKVISQFFFHRKIMWKKEAAALSGITATRAHSGKPPEKSVSGPIHCVPVLHPVYCNILGHIIVLCSSKTYSLMETFLISSFPFIPCLSSLRSSSALPSLHWSPISPALLHSRPPLGLEVFWADLHLHPFEGVGRAMPAVPGDAVQVLVVLPEAVEDPVEVGICAAVVPVSTFAELCALV